MGITNLRNFYLGTTNLCVINAGSTVNEAFTTIIINQTTQLGATIGQTVDLTALDTSYAEGAAFGST